MLTKQQKADIVTKFGGSEKNAGSTEAQIALATARITYLQEHFKSHKLDFHSKTGLMKLIGRRRRMLKYLNEQSPERYKALIGELGLRK